MFSSNISSSSSINHSIASKHIDSSSPFNLPYLPDELLLNCLARFSRLYYPTLTLVSKRFRSHLASNELYETRKLVNRTVICLYKCLRLDALNMRWFTLSRKPTRIPNPNKTSDNVMVSISTRNYSSPVPWCGQYVAVGSNIYKVGGYFDGEPSSEVLFMDCRFHTWHEAPSMQMAWNHNPVRVLDGKIYVAGGDDNTLSKMVDCFDPETQTWKHLPSLNGKIKKRSKIKSLAIKGKLYLFGKNNDFVYKSKENRWDDIVSSEMDFSTEIDYSTCVVDDVVYRYGKSGILQWFDIERRIWRYLKGMNELSKILPWDHGCIRLVDYGGKIAVLWLENNAVFKKIWCAEIALERRNKHKIYGKIEWYNVVLTLPKYSSFYSLQCVATTL